MTQKRKTFAALLTLNPEEEEPEQELPKLLCEPFRLVPAQNATEEEKNKLERANTLLHKYGVRTVGELINADKKNLQILVGEEMFDYIVVALNAYIERL